jgi:hypothetical protein
MEVAIHHTTLHGIELFSYNASSTIKFPPYIPSPYLFRVEVTEA